MRSSRASLAASHASDPRVPGPMTNRYESRNFCRESSRHNNAAKVTGRRGRLREAEELFLEAVAVCEHSRAVDSAQAAYILANLGEFYRECRRFADAEATFERALAVLGQDENASSGDFEPVVEKYALLLEEIGRRAAVETLRTRVEALISKPATSPDGDLRPVTPDRRDGNLP